MTTFRENNTTFDGQNHDRISRAEDAFAGETMLSSQDDGSDPVDLPARQKMLSAISGSLLTGLLGELPPLLLYYSYTYMKGN